MTFLFLCLTYLDASEKARQKDYVRLHLFITTECYSKLSFRDSKQTSGCLRMYWEKRMTRDVVKLQPSLFATPLKNVLEVSYKVTHTYLI